MIKFVQCIRRRPDVDPAQFRSQWEGYLDTIRSLAIATGAARLTNGHGLVHEQNALLQSSRNSEAPYDAIVEVWWQTGADAMRELEKPEAVTEIEKMQKLQETLVDFASSSFFFIDEEILLGS